MTDTTIKIKCLTEFDSKEFRELIYLFRDVFEEKNNSTPNNNYLRKILQNLSFWVYVAELDERIAGGLTAYELPQYNSEGSEIFLYDLAIRPEFQRKGIGRMLLSKLKGDAVAKGINEIFVAANDEDRHAIDFYKATGGQPEKVTHFNYLLKSVSRV